MIASASQLVMLLATAAAAVNAAADAPTATIHAPSCTATSSTGNGGFFDLRPDTAVAPLENGKSHKSGVFKDYHSRGYDYGKNFTLNICGAVVDPVSDVVGLKDNQWANVSAYYTTHNSVYSIGFV